MNKRRKKKIPNRKVVLKLLCYFGVILSFYVLGSVASENELIEPESLVIYLQGFDDMSFISFLQAWIYQLTPYAIIIISGYSHLGELYSYAVLSIKSFLSGYAVGASIIKALSNGGFSYEVFTLFMITEILFLILMISFINEQTKFRSYYIKKAQSPLKLKANKSYLERSVTKLGVILVLYIIRCAVCTFI